MNLIFTILIYKDQIINIIY